MKISNNNINSIEIKVSSNKNNKIFDKARQLALNLLITGNTNNYILI